MIRNIKLVIVFIIIQLFFSIKVYAAPNNVTINANNTGYYSSWSLLGATTKSEAVNIDDDETSYIYTNTSGLSQSFTVPSTSVTNAKISHVQVVARCYGDDSASYMTPRLKINGTQYSGNKRYNKVASWTTHYFDFYLNPNTGDDWLYTDIPNIQEVGLTINNMASGKTVRCSYLYILIVYEPDHIVPAISSVAIDTTTATITGLNFKTNNMKHEFLKDDIENLNEGVPFVNSNNTQNIYTDHYATIYTGDKYSGNKSIRFKWTDTTSTGTAVIKDFGEDITEAYLTAWIKINHNDDHTTFQWKNWRIKNSPTYLAGVENEYCIIGDTWCINGAWGNNDVQTFQNIPREPDGSRSLVSDAFLFNTWQRIEAYYKKSTPGQENGIFEWSRIGRPINHSIVKHKRVITHTTDANPNWRYIMWGHYYGNLSGGTYRDMEILYDDVYFAQTRARIEIGDAPVRDDCTHLEIQQVVSWNDTSAVVNLNKGTFREGDTVYFFVVDSDGIVSNGRQAVLGSGSITITDVIGDRIDNSSITVNGIGFGIKNNSHPLMYETFDNGVNGNNITGATSSHYGSWLNTYTDVIPTYTNLTRTNTGLCSYHPMDGTESGNHAPLISNFSDVNESTILVSYWTKFNYTVGDDPDWQLKYFRLTDGVSDTDDHTYLQDLWWTNRLPGLMGYLEFFLNPTNPEWPNYSDIQGYSDVSLDYNKVSGVWEHYTYAIKQGADGTGSCVVWKNGQKIANEPAMSTFETGEIVRSITLGWYLGNNVGTGTANLFFDDIYIDNAISRVEIGDDPIYDNCTHTELQPYTSWSNNSITFLFNKGSFLPNQQVYLFVIDENGIASPGRSITIGSNPIYDLPILSVYTNNQTTTASSIQISGDLTSDSDIVCSGVTVNGIQASSGDSVWDEVFETWNVNIPLTIGVNEITITGIDSQNQEETKTITITRIASPTVETTSTSLSHGVIKH